MWHQLEIESDSDEFTYHPYIDSDFDEELDDDLMGNQDKEAFGDDIVESSILIFSEFTPVITKITDVPKDSILIPLEVTSVITEFVAFFLKTLHPNALRTHLWLTSPLLALPCHK